MKAYKGTFVKKDGELRDMSFVKLEDISAFNSDFIASRIVEGDSPRRFGEGMELVWDLENDNFRVFNWSTATSTPEIHNVDDNLFI